MTKWRREMYVVATAVLLLFWISSTRATVSRDCREELLDVVVPFGDQPREDRLGKHQEFKDDAEDRKEELKLVLYGDSIIRHARRLGDDFFQSVYNEWYGTTMAYGISGNTAAEMLWCLRDGEFPRGMQPRAVVLLAGINDVLHAHHPGVDELESDDDSSQSITTIEVLDGSSLRQVVEQVTDALEYSSILVHQRSCGTKVVIVGLLPTSFGQDHRWPNRYTPAIAAVNDKLERMASQYTHITYADCSAIFLTEDGEGVREDMMPDGVHPNENGQVALALCLRDYLDLALSEEPPSNMQANESEEPAKEVETEDPTEEEEVEQTNGGGPEGTRTEEVDEGGEAAESEDKATEYRVEVGPWSSCPVPCGGGMQTRGSRCVRVATGEVVEMELCPGPKPASWELSQPCNTNICGDAEEAGTVQMSREARWVPGPWQPCELIQGCGEIDFVRDLTCVGADGRAVTSGPESACGSVFKPQSSAVRAKAVDLCSDTLTGSSRNGGSICNGRGTCVRPLGITAGQHRNSSSSCICNDGWSGPTCLVPESCRSGVIASSGACCDSGVISSVGECCLGSPAVTDANGRCCPVGSQLDDCGRCAPASSAVQRATAGATSSVAANALSHYQLTTRADVTGVCCEENSMSASGFCCLRDNVDECGICGGNGGSCALSATLRLNLPTDYRYPEDMDELGFGDVFSWLASSILVHVGGLAVSPDDVKVKRYVRIPEPPHRRRTLLQPLDVLSQGGENNAANQPLTSHEEMMGGFGAGTAASMRSLPVGGDEAADNDNLWEVDIELRPTGIETGHPLTTTFFKQVWEQAVADGGNLGGFELHPSPHVARKGMCGNGACETGEMARSSPDYCPADCPPEATPDSCPVPSAASRAPAPPVNTLTTPVGNAEQQCNGRGLCITLSRACSCFHGYTGVDCAECAAGFVAIVDAEGRGSCVAHAALLLGREGSRSQATNSGTRTILEPENKVETTSGINGGVEEKAADGSQSSGGHQTSVFDLSWFQQFDPWMLYTVVGLCSFMLPACASCCVLVYCRRARRAAEQRERASSSSSHAFEAHGEPEKRRMAKGDITAGNKGVRLEDLCDDADTIAAKQECRARESAYVQNFTNPVYSNDESRASGIAEPVPMMSCDAPPSAVAMIHNALAESLVDASTMLDDSTIIDIDDLSLLATQNVTMERESPVAGEHCSTLPDDAPASSPLAPQDGGPPPDISLDISMLSVGEEDVNSHYVEGPGLDFSIDLSMLSTAAAAPVCDEDGGDRCEEGAPVQSEGEPFQCSIEGIERALAVSNFCSSVTTDLETLPELSKVSVQPGIQTVSRSNSHSESDAEEGLESLVHQEHAAGEAKGEIVPDANTLEFTSIVDNSVMLSFDVDDSEEAPGEDVPHLAQTAPSPTTDPKAPWDETQTVLPDVPSIVPQEVMEWQQGKSELGEPIITQDDSIDPFSALFDDLPMSSTPLQQISSKDASKAPTYAPTVSDGSSILDEQYLSMNNSASAWQPDVGNTAMTTEKRCLSASTTPEIMSAWRNVDDDSENTFIPPVQHPKTSSPDELPLSQGNPFAEPSSPYEGTWDVQDTVATESSRTPGKEQQAAPPPEIKSENPFTYNNFLDLLG